MENIDITKNTELESGNQTNFQTLNSMWVTQIFFTTKFLVIEQGRNDSQTVSQKDNVGPSCLHTKVNFFEKTCDGIELRWFFANFWKYCNMQIRFTQDYALNSSSTKTFFMGMS
jgi:hypothetical protein